MRPKDRLNELVQRAAAAAAAASGARATPGPALQSGLAAQAGPVDAARDPRVEDIFTEVERIRGWILQLEGNTQLLRRLQADPTFHTNRLLQDQLDSVVAQSNGIGLKICGALRQFEGAATGDGGSGGTVRARIAQLQYACTRRLHAAALQRHHAALQTLRDRQLSLLHEQIKLTNLTISDEECEALLDSNNISLFVDNVRGETAAARLALREVEARRDELARVEAALRDVRDLFLQLAALVAGQQEQIDSVEYFALQASEHVELGGRELLRGTVSRTKARKKKLSVAACVAAGALLVLLVLLLT